MTDSYASALVFPADNWVNALFAANRLVRAGHRVLWVTQPLPGAGGTPAIAAGSFVVPLDPVLDPALSVPVSPATVSGILADLGIEATPLAVTGGMVAAPLGLIRVGLYGGGGAPMNQAAILAACGFPVRFISDAEVRAGYLNDIDVFIMPGGGTRAMNGQIEPLGDEGCRAITEFVRAGGMYIGCCAGTYDCIVNSDSFYAQCPAQANLQLLNAGPWRGDIAIEMFGGIQSPGVGVFEARNDRPDHPVMFGMPETFPMVHYNGPILDPLAESRIPGASGAIGLASFAGVTERFTPAEAFAGPAPADQPTYVSLGIAAERFAAASGEFGTGRVVAFGSHPELGADLALVDWFGAARMLANAVLWQATSVPGRQLDNDAVAVAGPVSLPLGQGYAAAARLLADLDAQARTVQQRPIEPRPSWLEPDYAMSTFGLPPDQIWRDSLQIIVDRSREAADLCGTLGDRVSSLLRPSDQPVPAVVRQAILAAEHRLLYQRAAAWNQDGGYQGVLALVQSAIAMCEQAEASWEIELGPPAGAYGYVDTNPYHLVAGSYLAAVGVIGAVVQLLRLTVSELDMAEKLGHDLRVSVDGGLVASGAKILA